jgi:hypothetical protein
MLNAQRPQIGGSGANPGVSQLLIQLQCMIRELGNKFSEAQQLHRHLERPHHGSRISKNEAIIAVHDNRLKDVVVGAHAIRNGVETGTKINDLIVKGYPKSAGENLVGKNFGFFTRTKYICARQANQGHCPSCIGRSFCHKSA